MTSSKSRRNFIGRFTLASVGTILLPTVAICNTNLHKQANGICFHEMDISTPVFGTKTMCVKGKVFSKKGTELNANAFVEVLSPDKRHALGKVKVNTDGHYRIKVNYPQREKGKLVWLNLKVSSPEDSYETALMVSDFDAYISDKHWERNHHLGEKLFPRKTDDSSTHEILFNLSI